MANLKMRFPENRTKALTLSYDDGVDSDKRFIDIIDRKGLKCTFNINSGRFAKEGEGYAEGKKTRRMTKTECVELYSSGEHEVAIHGYSHPFLEKMTEPEIVFEIFKDREILEEAFGRIVRGMAYPYGTYNDKVVEVLRTCGVAYSRTTVSTEKFLIPSDWLRMPATCHHNNPRLMELARTFVEKDNSNDQPLLFYLWGHTYEFVDNDNWEIIEEFSEYMGGRDEIWYATNIEIYEYVEAFRSLVLSADQTMAMNPSSKTVWFRFNKKDYVIAPRESIRLD